MSRQAAEASTAHVRGVDLDAVARWLAPQVGGLRGPLSAALAPGGRSNLTYVIGDGEREWVLRRPPLAHVLPTAHDMVREHRVISALGPTRIPVPRTVALCEDESVLGVRFYVMERVEGHVLRTGLPPAYPRAPATGAAIGEALIATLARLHAVVPEEVGLGDFGRPQGFLERQVRRWWKQWELSRTRELPAIKELRRRLERGLPASGPPAIVHGDYRLDNLMLAPDDPARVVAVLDWEMCTVGDPLADLGLLLVYWTDRDDPAEAGAGGLTMSRLTAESGFPTRAEIAAGYARHCGRDLSALDWYVALGLYKLAIVGEGIHARFLMGMTVGEGFERVGPVVPALVERALEVARGSALPGLSEPDA